VKAWALALLVLAGCGRAPDPGLAFYDWEPLSPLPAQDARWLKASGARAWVKLGRVEADGLGARVTPELSAEALEAYRGGRVTLCLRFERSFIAALAGLDADETARRTLAALDEARQAAGAQAVQVDGLQLDLDAPRSQLGWYAEYLRDLRAGLAPGLRLSVTCLPSWFRHPWDFWPVARACDYLVPLFFGDRIPARLQRIRPLGDEAALGLSWRLGRLYGRPLWAGLPAYQQVLVFGPDGRLLSAHSGLDLQALQSRPELKLLAQGQDGPQGGSRALYRVEQPLQVEGVQLSPGFQVLWQAVDAAQLAALAARARSLGGAAFQGWAIYRLEKHDGRQGLLAQAVAQALGLAAVESSGPLGELSVQRRSPGRWLCRARLRNPSLFSSPAWPGPSHLRVRIRGGAFVDAQAGQFSGMDWGVGLEQRLASSSLGRADTLDLWCVSMPAYSVLESGPIWVRGDPAALQLFTSVQSASALGPGWDSQLDRQVFPVQVPAQWQALPLTAVAGTR
jgi:hypothetical protein